MPMDLHDKKRNNFWSYSNWRDGGKKATNVGRLVVGEEAKIKRTAIIRVYFNFLCKLVIFHIPYGWIPCGWNQKDHKLERPIVGRKRQHVTH
jgi:hypothetical protein